MKCQQCLPENYYLYETLNLHSNFHIYFGIVNGGVKSLHKPFALPILRR